MAVSGREAGAGALVLNREFQFCRMKRALERVVRAECQPECPHQEEPWERGQLGPSHLGVGTGERAGGPPRVHDPEWRRAPPASHLLDFAEPG